MNHKNLTPDNIIIHLCNKCPHRAYTIGYNRELKCEDECWVVAAIKELKNTKK